MGTSSFNSWSIILACFALFVSAISVLVSAVMFYISDKRSAESNRLATEANISSRSANDISTKANIISVQALDVARFGLRKEYQPILSGEQLRFDYSNKHPEAFFDLQNHSLSKSIIYKIEPILYSKVTLDETDLDYPFKLGYNQRRNFRIVFHNDVALHLLRLENVSEEIIKKVKSEETKLTMLRIFFADEAGNKYDATLSYMPFEQDNPLDTLVYAAIRYEVLPGRFEITELSDVSEDYLHYFV